MQLETFDCKPMIARGMLFLLLGTLGVDAANPGGSGTGEQCLEMRQPIAYSESAGALLTEVRAQFPDWSLKAFKSVRWTSWGLELVLDDLDDDAILEIGHTGADADRFVAKLLTIGPSLRMVNGLSAHADLQVLFRRKHRHHRLHKAPKALPQNTQTVVLTLPLVLNSWGLKQPQASNVGEFLKAAWENETLHGGHVRLDLGASLRKDNLWSMVHRATVINGKHVQNACALNLFVAVHKPVISSYIPNFPAVHGLSRSKYVLNSFEAQFSLGLFPHVGDFTAKELYQRWLLYGSLIASAIVCLMSAGMLLTARKQGVLGSSDGGGMATIRHEGQSYVMMRREDPDALSATEMDDTAPATLVADAALVESVDAPSIPVMTDTGFKPAKGWRWTMERIVLVVIYVMYVVTCTFAPMMNIMVTTCYEGTKWENHMPFFSLFVITKTVELVLYGSSPYLAGEVTMLWFVFLFGASMSGFFDGYADGTAIAVVYQCGCFLWKWMAICFLVGIVLFQWVILGLCAFFLDSSGKCFYKVLHMDLLAKCTELDPGDPYAALVWRAINWARFITEDVPQGGMQLYVIFYVQKTLVMMISVFLAVCSSAYAVYSATNLAVALSAEFLQKSRVARTLAEELRLSQDPNWNRKDALEQAYNQAKAHLESDDPMLSEASAILNPARPLYTFEDGRTYLGEWKGTSRHGTGVQVWPDGARYEGEWRNDKAEGHGKFDHADGDVYEGQWKADKAYGHGTYTHVDDSVYTGQWLEDKQDGEGVEKWPDGATFQGQYKQGQKTGNGHFKWSDGASYDGQFELNDIQGEGVYEWADGRQFQGQWNSNRMDGKGLFTWSDGRIYEGEYQADTKHGTGIFQWPDGRRWEGQWQNGKQHGSGVHTTAKGERRKGVWEEGKRQRWIDGVDQGEVGDADVNE